MPVTSPCPQRHRSRVPNGHASIFRASARRADSEEVTTMDPLCVVPARVQGLGLGLPLALALLLFSSDALAQSRRVFVNGQWLTDAQVAALARTNCRDIPNGAYWLNTQTGAWGYAGNPRVQGAFGEACNNGREAAGGINRDGTHGPFATMRRAEEEAAKYHARGYRANAFHNGDGYYIRVSR